MSNDLPGPAGIIVVESANQDYIVRVPEPAHPGETVLATDLLKQPGGKGANQAVAMARLGGDVSFVASVGDDPDGAQLVRELRSEGVDTSSAGFCCTWPSLASHLNHERTAASARATLALLSPRSYKTCM